MPPRTAPESPPESGVRETRAGAVAFILKGYPRLSETFIAQEIRALEARGLDIRIVSLRHPTDTKRHLVHGEIRAAPLYLPEYLWHEPLRVGRAWRAARHLPGYRAARSAFLADLARDPTPNRIRRFGQALVLAHELPEDVRRLHAHFIHTPASVARYTALLRDLPWSVSAHAKDIWTTAEWETREKLRDCLWAVTCTRVAAAHLAGLAPEPGRVELIYHGIDGVRFPAPPRGIAARDGSDPRDPVRLLSVGRAVAKKGYDDLLASLAQLPPGLHWRFIHVGGGPLLDRLKRQAGRLGIADRIDWRGAQAQETVLAAYRAADLFVLASRVAKDGDRDGLPNVLVEAQSQGVACLATSLPGIAELIGDGVTGALVPQGDPRRLAEALVRLIRAPAERARLGSAGETLVRARFTLESGIERLAQKFGLEESGLEESGAPCALRSTHR